MREILPDLFLFEDSCNVYLIRRGRHAIAIDFGTGRVLESLNEIAVEQIDWILHTHHHQDQCVGDGAAVAQGTKLAVPEWEAHHFTEAELFWSKRSMFHMYNMHTNFQALRESVPVEVFLQDFTQFTWKDVTLGILPAPGHTQGQVAFLWKRDNGPVAFVGDMIRDDGRVETIYDLQLSYGNWEGMAQSVRALDYLRDFEPKTLYPSHGSPVEHPDEAIGMLSENMLNWQQFYGSAWGPRRDWRETRLDEVVPGVYHSAFSNASHWTLLSKSGKALFIDYGANHNVGLAPMFHLPGESDRFVPYSLKELRSLGMKSVDVVIPTHYHDDHTPGFAYLQRVEGTAIWCYDNMVDVFEMPAGEILGCTVPTALEVDRVLDDGETFQWEEFTLQIRHTPGHSIYHCSLFLERAGHKLAFTGDLTFMREERDADGRRKPAWNLIPLNRNRPGDHSLTADILLEYEPDIICPGHGGSFEVTRNDLLAWKESVAAIPKHFGKLVGERSVDRAVDFHWAQVYPYEQAIEAGVPFRAEIRIRSYLSAPAPLSVTARLPKGWEVLEPDRECEIEPGEVLKLCFTITPAERVPNGPSKVAYGFSVVLNGKPLGEACVGLGSYIRYPYHQ